MNQANEQELSKENSDSGDSDFSGGLSFSDRSKTRARTKECIIPEVNKTIEPGEINDAEIEATMNDGRL